MNQQLSNRKKNIQIDRVSECLRYSKYKILTRICLEDVGNGWEDSILTQFEPMPHTFSFQITIPNISLASCLGLCREDFSKSANHSNGRIWRVSITASDVDMPPCSLTKLRLRRNIFVNHSDSVKVLLQDSELPIQTRSLPKLWHQGGEKKHDPNSVGSSPPRSSPEHPTRSDQAPCRYQPRNPMKWGLPSGKLTVPY